jgi:transcriptional regulator with XRE-family HTH domain
LFVLNQGGVVAQAFDSEAFYAALNAVRLSKQMTWKDVAAEAGVNASTLSRIGQGANPDVEGLAQLLAWSKLKAEMFIPGTGEGEAEPLARITALLRADPKLSTTNAQLIENIVVATYKQLKKDD